MVENLPSKCVAGLLNLTVAHVVHTTLTSRAKSPLSLSRPAVQLFPRRESGSPTHLCELSIPGVEDHGPEPSIEGNLKRRGKLVGGLPLPHAFRECSPPCFPSCTLIPLSIAPRVSLYPIRGWATKTQLPKSPGPGATTSSGSGLAWEPVPAELSSKVTQPLRQQPQGCGVLGGCLLLQPAGDASPTPWGSQ